MARVSYLAKMKNWLFVFYCVNLCILQEYRILFEESGNNPGDKTLEDKFFEHEVCAGCCLTDVVFEKLDYSCCCYC